jgi:hypothetical protein
MRRAVDRLRLTPAKVLVDGNRIPVLTVRAEAVTPEGLRERVAGLLGN